MFKEIHFYCLWVLKENYAINETFKKEVNAVLPK